MYYLTVLCIYICRILYIYDIYVYEREIYDMERIYIII